MRMARGERFVPAAVDAYVGACALYLRHPDGDVELAAPGTVDISNLATIEGGRSGTYLRFVSEKERQAARGTRWRLRLDGPGRLTRVGLVGRIADALFRLSLLVRRTVPGGVAAAASDKARRLGMHEHAVYYGRVVRDGGWTALHYQFFYAMNDWRSAFGGVNDHEADWEQILVFVEEVDGPGGTDVRPRWLAYATHDHTGDDLRRSWDDPDVEKVGEHPVIYAGGGSHASYFQRGEYVTRMDVPALRLLLRFQTWFRRLAGGDSHPGGFGIPFVDVAPGDGVTVGAGGDREWHPELLDPDASWVADFRGLWGLDTADFTGGERAPAGPRFERDGSVRQVWSDPVGYAGMHKVVPPAAEAQIRSERLAALEVERAELGDSFEQTRNKLRAEILVGALGPEETRTAEAELKRLRRAESTLRAEQRRLEVGHQPQLDPRAHLAHPAVPEPLRPANRRRILNLWGALSAPLILAMLAVAVVSPAVTAGGFALGILLLLVVEALIRGHLLRWLFAALVVAVIVVIVVVALRNWRWALGGAFAAFAFVILVGNARELFGRR